MSGSRKAREAEQDREPGEAREAKYPLTSWNETEKAEEAEKSQEANPTQIRVPCESNGEGRFVRRVHF